MPVYCVHCFNCSFRHLKAKWKYLGRKPDSAVLCIVSGWNISCKIWFPSTNAWLMRTCWWYQMSRNWAENNYRALLAQEWETKMIVFMSFSLTHWERDGVQWVLSIITWDFNRGIYWNFNCFTEIKRDVHTLECAYALDVVLIYPEISNRSRRGSHTELSELPNELMSYLVVGQEYLNHHISVLADAMLCSCLVWCFFLLLLIKKESRQLYFSHAVLAITDITWTHDSARWCSGMLRFAE